MTKKISYLIELSSLNFSDVQTDANGAVSTWIQAMPLGKYSHPVYGEIDITPEKVVRFADNVNRKVRGQDLDIDYDHKEYNGEAAGWVQQAESRPTGLWVLVEWTAKAWEAIKSKAYRYFSPEFDDEWSNPKTGEKFTDVLFGGGITNRPFLKDILPLNLSEKFSELEGEKNMTPEQIKELFALIGLEDGASFDDMKAKFAELDAKNKADAAAAADNADKSTEPAGADTAPVDASNAANLAPALSEEDVKKLSENPATKKLLSAMEAQAKQLEEQSKQFKEMAVKETVAKLSEASAKTGRGLTPNTQTALSEIYKAVDTKTASLVTKLFENFIGGSATVKLSEPRFGDPSERTDSKKFSDRVTDIMKSENIDYREAAIKAAMEADDDDFNSYRAGDE